MRVERAIYSVLIIVASAFAIVNWRRATLLALDNEQLRSRVETLEDAAMAATNVIDFAREQSHRIRTQTSELMRLRNEVTQLRGESNKLEVVTIENQRLKSELSRAATAADSAKKTDRNAVGNFPRESWTFSGYGSPEAALVSAIWSMKEGNPRSYLESLAPSEQERMALLENTQREAQEREMRLKQAQDK